MNLRPRKFSHGGKLMKKYQIERVLSNNAVVALDDEKNEIIALGNGIGFSKKRGDIIFDLHFEKVFRKDSSELLKKLISTLSKGTSEFIEIADATVRFAKEDLGRDLNEYIYVLLTDHLNFAVERLKQNITLPCPMLSEIQCLYKDEYKVACKVVAKVKEQMNINLPISEAGFIALHIMNASENDISMNEVLSSVVIVNEIIQIIKEFFKMEFDTDSLNYYRLLIHLNFFAKRVIQNEKLKEEEDIIDMFQGKYFEQRKCAEKISGFLLEEYQYQTSESEKLYLVIHINRCIFS